MFQSEPLPYILRGKLYIERHTNNLYLPLLVCRYDLDACDIQEKFPENFTVTLNVAMSTEEDVSAKNQSHPWDNFSTKGLNPNILFTSKEEQATTLHKFGKNSPWFFTSLFCYLTEHLLFRPRRERKWFEHFIFIEPSCSESTLTSKETPSNWSKTACSTYSSRWG